MNEITKYKSTVNHVIFNAKIRKKSFPNRSLHWLWISKFKSFHYLIVSSYWLVIRKQAGAWSHSQIFRGQLESTCSRKYFILKSWVYSTLHIHSWSYSKWKREKLWHFPCDHLHYFVDLERNQITFNQRSPSRNNKKWSKLIYHLIRICLLKCSISHNWQNTEYIVFNINLSNAFNCFLISYLMQSKRSVLTCWE